MSTSTLFVRELLYRDDSGALNVVRVETTDPAELERVARFYGRMEERSLGKETSWQNGHATFTDAKIKPDEVADAAGAKKHDKGFPWDSDDERYCFALFLGEGALDYAPSAWHTHTEEGRDGKPDRASYGNEVVKGGECPLHDTRPLPLFTCCLYCCRTGRDVAIPRPTTLDLKRRHERMPAYKPAEATKLPAPLRDRMGKVLAGGLAGKR